jgi:hypothetical protein
MLWGIKLEGWLTIGAIILGPILAFVIQNERDKRREEKTRKRIIFQQLLLTLKVPMAPRHVDALNSIPLEFYSNVTVMQAWREYSSHLNNKEMLRNNPRGWGDRKYELLITLAYEAGQSIGYAHIDKATLRDNIYVPQGYDDTEQQSADMRSSLLQVLRGQRAIPVTMVGPVQVEEPLGSPVGLARPDPQLPELPNP